MEQPDDRPAAQPGGTGRRRACRRGGDGGGRRRLPGRVIGLRAANGGREPEGQNWWLVAWFVAGLAYSLAGTVLLARPGRRTLGSWLLVVGAGSVVGRPWRSSTAATSGRWPGRPAGRPWPARARGRGLSVPPCSWRSSPASWSEHGGARTGAARVVVTVAAAATVTVVLAEAAGGTWSVSPLR